MPVLRRDVDNLRVVIFLLSQHEMPPPEWVARLLALGLLAVDREAWGHVAVTPKAIRLLDEE